MPHEHHLRVARTARYFTLGEDAALVRELWLVLHGYGSLAASFIKPFTALDDGSRLIVAPEALNRFYQVPPEQAPPSERPVGASWMTREDREHEIADYLGYLDEVCGAVLLRLLPDVTRAMRTIVLGFSQGAATAARWVGHTRVTLNHLVLWGGSLPPELDLAAASSPLRRTPLTFVVGSRDAFVTPAVVQEQERRLRDAGVSYSVRRYEGGHSIPRAELTALAAILSGQG